jgi:glycosyltransferase involved in cell wall biosynthesis
MRYVLIGPTYPYRGGISHYTTLLYQHLGAAHEVKLYSFKRQYPARLFPGRTDRDPSRSPLRADCEYLLDPSNPLTWLETFRRIKGDRPDALILQWWVPYWAPAFTSIAFLVRKFTPIRVLFICHNVMPHEGSAIDRLSAKLTLGQGHCFIVQSQKDWGNLKRLLPEAEARKAVLPIYDAFSSEVMESALAKKTLGLDGPVILFFGFIRQYKGLEYLIRAMPEVLRSFQVKLLIVGEFWEDKEPYLKTIEELGLQGDAVVVDRYVPNEEVGLYFSAADLVVLPYVDATQSAIVSLAYAFDKPVITTDVGGLAEVVKDGATGLIVPPQDSAALAQSVIRYFEEDLGRKFVPNIRVQMAGDILSWNRLVRLIEEVCM